MSITPAQNSLRGIGMMLLGIGLFACGDALGKLLAGLYPTGEILMLRSIAPLVLLLPFLRRDQGAPQAVPQAVPRSAPQAARHWGLHVLRAVLSTAEATCFFAAVARLPLADALCFYLAGPIYVTALGALLLGERVGRARWGAVLVGFVGVLVALHPSARSLHGGSLIALGGSLAYAGLMIVTRALRSTAAPVLTAWQFAGALLFGAALARDHWLAPPPGDLALLCGSGVVSLFGNLCVNRSLRLADASVVVPYQYTIIVWATLNGWAFFGDVPHLPTLLGAAIIVAAGLFIGAREARRAGTRAAPAANDST